MQVNLSAECQSLPAFALLKFEMKEGEESMCIKGTTEVEFVLDYGDCPKKVIEPGKKIKLPKLNSMKKYISAGTLDRVLVPPYFIQ